MSHTTITPPREHFASLAARRAELVARLEALETEACAANEEHAKFRAYIRDLVAKRGSTSLSGASDHALELTYRKMDAEEALNEQRPRIQREIELLATKLASAPVDILLHDADRFIEQVEALARGEGLTPEQLAQVKEMPSTQVNNTPL